MPRITRTVARSGFTLIELLVVIAIIAALMALSAAAVIRFLGVQQTSNTQTELSRVQGELNKVYSKVKDDAVRKPGWDTELVPGGGGQTVHQYILANLAGTDPNAQKRASVIYLKLKLRQAFPMNFSEALNPYPLPALRAYSSYLGGLGITGSSGAPYESSACLLMALQRSVSGQAVDLADIGGGGAIKDFQTQTGTIPALVDAWGSPLAFTRAPTGSIVMNPNGPQAGANDPTDPQGLLNTGSTTGWPQTTRTAFFNLIQQQMAPSAGMSYRIAPMVASAGPDRTWQINTITFGPTTVGATGDDLFSNP